MAKKCHTDLGEVWITTVKGTLEGAFTVISEDAAGKFDGIYSGDKIAGDCTGTEITFRRPTKNSRFEYWGRFSRSGDGVKGTRRSLKKSPFVDEEWEGVKTTTRLAKKSRARS